MKMEKERVKKKVRENYAKIAVKKSSCCGPTEESSTIIDDLGEDLGKKIGYSEEDLKSVPEGANMSLGCGNPVALASLEEGEVVLDLGSGGGFDCFLAATKVGPSGKVIGVDMTPEMIEKGNYENVEFRLGEIEHLPTGDNTVDVIISNCVINLSPEKGKVFTEAYRVLKPGGRLMISDIVLQKEIPEEIRNSIEAYVGCIAGAMKKDEYIQKMRDAGFKDVKVESEKTYSDGKWIDDEAIEGLIKKFKVNLSLDEIKDSAKAIASIQVKAIK